MGNFHVTPFGTCPLCSIYENVSERYDIEQGRKYLIPIELDRRKSDGKEKRINLNKITRQKEVIYRKHQEIGQALAP